MPAQITGSARGAGTPQVGPTWATFCPGPHLSAAPSRHEMAAGVMAGVTASMLGTESAGGGHISSPHLGAWPPSLFAVPMGPTSLHRGGGGGGLWSRTAEQTALGCGHLDRVRAGATSAVWELLLWVRTATSATSATSSPPCWEQGGPCSEVADGEQEGATPAAHAVCHSQGAKLRTPAALPEHPHQSLRSELTSQPGPQAR